MTHTARTTDGLRELYYRMLRIRIVEETISRLYAEQEMRCPVHLSIGQEAAAVGACAALAPGDYALSAHRSHGHYLAKGGDLKLCAMSKQVRAVFELVRMHRIFEIYPTKEEAVRAFAPQHTGS